MSDFVTVTNLTRSFRSGSPAVDHITFSVRRGEIFSLLGPNGAGKTTTIRLLSGLIYPTSGEVRILGMVSTDPSQMERIHNAIGLLPEVPGLYESLSAMENLRFYGRMHGLSDTTIHERARELLSVFDIWDRRDEKVATYSKGMKQKVAIVRALLHDPECLILDEPLSGLDPEAAKSTRDFLVEQRQRGRTVIVSTHNLDDADRLSDRVAVIRSRLLALDTPSDLKSRLFHSRVGIRLQNGSPSVLDRIRSLPGVVDASWEPPTLMLELAEPDNELPDVISALVGAGLRLQYVTPTEHTLEDVYLKLVDEARNSAGAGS